MTGDTQGQGGRSRRLVQLVAPGSGGVRDYADLLASRWAQQGVISELLTLSAPDAAQQSLPDRLQRLHDKLGRPSTLLLQYSGYGFQRRGLCQWLARELEQTRRQLGDAVHVITMFHELFAFGPPWRSAFWLSPAQASIAARVARASGTVLTNTAHYARWLQAKAGKDVAVEVRPVFSNVGEPATLRATVDRSAQLLVFGSASTRQRALAGLHRHAALLKRMGIQAVVEVGSGEPSPASPIGLPHRFVGRHSVAALGALLQESAFGLIDYPPALLAKSGVFAAYVAHGNVVLNTSSQGGDADGLRRGQHFLTLSTATPLDPAAQQVLANAAHAWYTGHALGLQAQALVRASGAGSASS